MHIERVATKQFKCFESVDLSFPKLTLLTGANSSGKSSLLHAVLAPFQSTGFPLYLSPNGKYVNMGDFVEMAHMKLRSHPIGHHITISTGESEKSTFHTQWVIDSRSSLPRLNSLSVEGLFLKIDVSREPATGKYVLSLKHDAKAYSKSPEFKVAQMVRSFVESVLKAQAEEAKGSKAKLERARKELFRVGNIRSEKLGGVREVEQRLTSMPSMPTNRLLSVFNHMDACLNFISSFRLAPERTYYERAKADTKIGRAGENHIDQIVEWERRRSHELRELRDSLKELKLWTGIKTTRLRGGRFEVSVKTVRGGVWSALTDVGFGISQFLPVAVADIQLGPGSTLAVAQPEIHLHPSVQASLGDYLASRIVSQNKRYIIETHSEYLLNRIRLLVVKGELEPKDLAVYYFHREDQKTDVLRVEFTKSGKVEGAPQDFFETYMMDVMDIAMNAK